MTLQFLRYIETIENSSFDPFPQKLAVYDSMYHRLLSDKNFRCELNVIKQIVRNNGSTTNLTGEMLPYKLFKQSIGQINPMRKEKSAHSKWIWYFVEVSENVKNLLTNYEVKVSMKTKNLLGRSCPYIIIGWTLIDKNHIFGSFEILH